MRWSALPLLPLVAACSADDPDVAVFAEDLGVDWSGRFEGNGTCLDGEVMLSLHPREDGGFEGTYDYRSPRPGDDISATYRVEGEIVDGALFVQQRELIDVSAPELHWCFGELAMAMDPQEQGGLVGSWVPGNCSCDGAVFVSPAG